MICNYSKACFIFLLCVQSSLNRRSKLYLSGAVCFMNCLKLEKVVVCMGYVYYVTMGGTVYFVHTSTIK